MSIEILDVYSWWEIYVCKWKRNIVLLQVGKMLIFADRVFILCTQGCESLSVARFYRNINRKSQRIVWVDRTVCSFKMLGGASVE